MTGQHDTERLLDDAGTPQQLRDMLEAAVADEPSPAASARMMARLDGLAAGGAASATAAGTAKWILLALAGIVAIGAVIYGLAARDSDTPRDRAVAERGAAEAREARAATPADTATPAEHAPTPATAPATARDTPPITVEPLAEPETADPIEPTNPAASTEPDEPTARRQPATAPTEPAARKPAPPSEIDIIKRARAALRAGNHRGALGQAKRHASLYAGGALAEEREAIAVESLTGLGRGDAARERFKRFLGDYPASSYRQRLRGLVSPPE